MGHFVLATDNFSIGGNGSYTDSKYNAPYTSLTKRIQDIRAMYLVVTWENPVMRLLSLRHCIV